CAADANPFLLPLLAGGGWEGVLFVLWMHFSGAERNRVRGNGVRVNFLPTLRGLATLLVRKLHSDPISQPQPLFSQPTTFRRTDTCTSASCLSGTSLGAPVIRHCAVVVLGKAITSRIDSVPAISAAMRSMPNAMPPCGGAPYRSASSRKPNLACASSAPMPSRSNTALCIDERWMRIEPPPISLPLSTMS